MKTDLHNISALRMQTRKVIRWFCYVAFISLMIFRGWIAFEDQNLKRFANIEAKTPKRL